MTRRAPKIAEMESTTALTPSVVATPEQVAQVQDAPQSPIAPFTFVVPADYGSTVNSAGQPDYAYRKGETLSRWSDLDTIVRMKIAADGSTPDRVLDVSTVLATEVNIRDAWTETQAKGKSPEQWLSDVCEYVNNLEDDAETVALKNLRGISQDDEITLKRAETLANMGTPELAQELDIAFQGLRAWDSGPFKAAVPIKAIWGEVLPKLPVVDSWPKGSVNRNHVPRPIQVTDNNPPDHFYVIDDEGKRRPVSFWATFAKGLPHIIPLENTRELLAGIVASIESGGKKTMPELSNVLVTADVKALIEGNELPALKRKLKITAHEIQKKTERFKRAVRYLQRMAVFDTDEWKKHVRFGLAVPIAEITTTNTPISVEVTRYTKDEKTGKTVPDTTRPWVELASIPLNTFLRFDVAKAKTWGGRYSDLGQTLKRDDPAAKAAKGKVDQQKKPGAVPTVVSALIDNVDKMGDALASIFDYSESGVTSIRTKLGSPAGGLLASRMIGVIDNLKKWDTPEVRALADQYDKAQMVHNANKIALDASREKLETIGGTAPTGAAA